MKLIDTHCHIYSEEFESDYVQAIERALALGVDKIFMPNVDSRSIDRMLMIEAQFPNNCFAMMGLHPCSVKDDFENELAIAESWLAKRKFVAIGEMGTDLYWDKTHFEQQKEAFRIQVGWAKKYDLPIVIHCRDSFEETMQLLEPLADNKLTGVFHCFTGSVQDALRVKALGFHIGIGGVSTFKNGGLDKVIPEIGLDKLVLETDSPYLAPVPFRGKRNEPSYTKMVAQRVADLLAIPIEKVAEATTQNALELYKMRL